jgi:hypothetical protein
MRSEASFAVLSLAIKRLPMMFAIRPLAAGFKRLLAMRC